VAVAAATWAPVKLTVAEELAAIAAVTAGATFRAEDSVAALAAACSAVMAPVAADTVAVNVAHTGMLAAIVVVRDSVEATATMEAAANSVSTTVPANVVAILAWEAAILAA
jgi:hypothetical protein